MGKFIYGTMATSAEVDDRVLAHLRIAIMTKLRRGESFMFELEMGDGSGRRTFWMHPSVPVQLQFYGSRQPRINPAWVEALLQSASGLAGLTIVPEPPSSRREPGQPSNGLGEES